MPFPMPEAAKTFMSGVRVGESGGTRVRFDDAPEVNTRGGIGIFWLQFFTVKGFSFAWECSHRNQTPLEDLHVRTRSLFCSSRPLDGALCSSISITATPSNVK